MLAFPSNDFLGQEPGSNEEVQTFCKRKYDVSFPVFAKVSVTGDAKIPLYRYLTESRGGFIPWNFTKFLIGRDGKPLDRFAPWTKPDSPALREAVERALAAR